MIDLIARVSSSYGPTETITLTRIVVAVDVQVVSLNAEKSRLNISFTARVPNMLKVENHIAHQADSLLLELDVWCNGLSAMPQHARVSVSIALWRSLMQQKWVDAEHVDLCQCGDYIYKYMANIYILGEVC